MSKVKYFGSYYNPPYGSFDPYGEMDGFKSIKEAKESMRYRLEGRDVTNLYRQNADGNMILWRTYVDRDFPCPSVRMDLYPAYSNGDGTWCTSEEPMYRLSIGPRGGVVVE